MNGPVEILHQALVGHSAAAIPLAMAGGLVMALNPCCVALYPAAAASCCAAGNCDTPRPRLALTSAIAFVLGTALATTALGVMAAVAGRTLTGLGGWWRYAVALVPLVMGLHTLGWIRVPMPRALSVGNRAGIGGAFLTGLLLALAIGPCGTPVLATILSYAAYRGSASYGAALLFAYGVGAGLPALLIGAGAGNLAQRLDRVASRSRVDGAAGLLLIGVGLYLLWSA